MPTFGAYSLLDFSARSTPSPIRPSSDACWLGTRSCEQPFEATYFRTRAAAMTAWSAWVSQQVSAKHRVLAGFDFALGYPHGFTSAARLAGRDAPWKATWEQFATRIEDDERNRNNRFHVASELNERAASESAGPFWGGPAGMLTDCDRLTSKRHFDWPFQAHRGTQLARLRITDRRARNAQEVWKLAGIGSVGSQSLLGIAALAWLLGLGLEPAAIWAPYAHVWPFQTGFALPVQPATPAVVIAEAFPSMLGQAVDAHLDQHDHIGDAAQVQAWCEWAHDLDQREQLAACFGPPADLTAEERAACVAEEGWILGVA